jgi:D-alanyl-D-alanine carboxypeptidase/D-alanyl-D-alanine-endopeptidase (penicillin-binding protein 4)
VELLGWVDQQPWSEVFFSALPISGIDGTLKKRMTSNPLRGIVYAKTGTLKNASGLAGYLKDDQHEESVVFAFLYDGRPGIVYRARKWQEDCLSLIQK